MGSESGTPLNYRQSIVARRQSGLVLPDRVVQSFSLSGREIGPPIQESAHRQDKPVASSKENNQVLTISGSPIKDMSP